MPFEPWQASARSWGKPALAGDIRLPGTRATDIAPLGLNTRPQALSFSHGSEAVAVGYRMAPAKAGSTPGELNFMLANSVGQEVRPVF